MRCFLACFFFGWPLCERKENEQLAIAIPYPESAAYKCTWFHIGNGVLKKKTRLPWDAELKALINFDCVKFAWAPSKTLWKVHYTGLPLAIYGQTKHLEYQSVWLMWNHSTEPSFVNATPQEWPRRNSILWKEGSPWSCYTATLQSSMCAWAKRGLQKSWEETFSPLNHSCYVFQIDWQSTAGGNEKRNHRTAHSSPWKEQPQPFYSFIFYLHLLSSTRKDEQYEQENIY